MDVVITPTLYEDYFNSISRFPKSEFENDLNSLINNPLNRFVISRDYVDYLEKKNAGNPKWEVMSVYLMQLINNPNSVLRIHDDKSTTEDAIIKSLDKNYQSDKKISKKPVFVIFSKTNTIDKLYCVNITKVKKPNTEWALLKLASYHPASVTLRYHDFSNDVQISNLVANLININITISPIFIFDRQVNLEHRLFDSFKRSNTIHYYMSSKKYDDYKATLKKNFGTLKVYSAHTNDIHERKIVCNSLMIEADDDFSNITIQRTTWKLDLTYCQNSSDTQRKKAIKFKRELY
jgi:hypothetical protein